MTNGTKTIERIKIIDDDPAVREVYTFPVTIADRVPVEEKGPLGSLAGYLNRPTQADAAVSDHQLRPSGYAAFDGANLVAEWYKRGFPAILCTTFEKSNADQFRSLRRWLPIVMSPTQLSPDSLMEGLEVVQRELQDKFIPPRRPWRALVHFVDFRPATKTVYAKLPGWSTEAVALRLVDLPTPLQERCDSLIDRRFYATANLGAESNEELYISNWEV